ncbi:uncharacterized protein N7459_005119 [Penicillium hispanicum]|uniref:uncharacterized protein n=1 Tax=Penicillium hispanicum TaxID=1080232 RepID=UPI00254132DD|nr:uncharacterized protein N7459_005119 [Penicillium hispanicum]KAJ5585319.1 hypothetical protein N7459_005119 [Penicillium hispanicum]
MTTGNPDFRLATPDDATSIQRLVQSAFRAEDSRQDWTAITELNESFRVDVHEVLAGITKPGSAIILAVNDSGNLVGSITVIKGGSNRARLAMLAVDPGHQQGGLGRQILTYAEEYCRRVWGATKSGLNALSTRQALISWYKRRGYYDTGETSPFPREKFSGLALPADLCFIELEKDLVSSRG